MNPINFWKDKFDAISNGLFQLKWNENLGKQICLYHCWFYGMTLTSFSTLNCYINMLALHLFGQLKSVLINLL